MSVQKLAVALAAGYSLINCPPSFAGDWTTDPKEQNNRLQHLPGDLPLAIMSLRAFGYTTKVSTWDENKRKLTADGDAGRYRWDGYRDFHYLDYYTLKFQGLVNNQKEAPVSVPEDKAKKAISNLPLLLGRAVERLISKERFLVVKAKLPSCVDDSTTLRLERTGQRIDIFRGKYDYSVPHSHACDWWD